MPGTSTHAICASICMLSPRSPQYEGLPPIQGETRKGQGGGSRLCISRNTGMLQNASNPWMKPLFYTPPLGWESALGLFLRFFATRVAQFFPRVALISPRVCFLSIQALLSTSLSILRREKRDRKGKKREIGHPRVANVSRGYITDDPWKKGVFLHEPVGKFDVSIVMNQWLMSVRIASTGFRREMRYPPRASVGLGSKNGKN